MERAIPALPTIMYDAPLRQQCERREPGDDAENFESEDYPSVVEDGFRLGGDEVVCTDDQRGAALWMSMSRLAQDSRRTECETDVHLP